MAVRTEVRTYNGTPTLFINEAPHTGLTFFRRADGGDEEIHLFAEKGVELFSCGIGVSQTMQKDGEYDSTPVQQTIDRILSKNPETLLLFRIGLGVKKGYSPDWLVEEYHNEMMECINLKTGARSRPQISFASSKWRTGFSPALKQLIAFCEEIAPDNIIGYQPAAGASGEWAYSWWEDIGDFSTHQVSAFREWLRKKYRNDKGLLRTTWAIPSVCFETAQIPQDELLSPKPRCFYDPATERQCIDYLQFHSEIVADAAIHFAGITKSALSELERTKLCGIFYGYHFRRFYSSSKHHTSGHHAQQRILECPDIDFLAAPNNYECRYEGGIYHPQPITGSLRLHGKLFWDEDDTFPPTAEPRSHRYSSPSVNATISIQKRNFAGNHHEGGTQWFMECYTWDWYRKMPELLDGIEAISRLAAKRLSADRTPCSRVALIVGDDAMPYLRRNELITDSLNVRQIHELCTMGASYDSYRLSDLELLTRQPWFGNYRLFIFAGTFVMTPADRTTIREHLQCNGKHLLWLYGSDIIGDRTFDLSAAAALTGIPTAPAERPEPAIIDTSLPGERMYIGSRVPLDPLLKGIDDKNGEVLGRLIASGSPGLVRRTFSNWTSIWSASPFLPASLLRHFAKAAGVHIYCNNGSQVIEDHGLLTVHAATSGEYQIALPEPAKVADAYTDRTIATRTDLITINLERGNTVTFALN